MWQWTWKMEREREIVVTCEKIWKLDQVEWQPAGDRASLAGEELGSLRSATSIMDGFFSAGQELWFHQIFVMKWKRTNVREGREKVVGKSKAKMKEKVWNEKEEMGPTVISMVDATTHWDFFAK